MGFRAKVVGVNGRCTKSRTSDRSRAGRERKKTRVARVFPASFRKPATISCFCLKIQSQESYKYLYLSSKNKNNISNIK